MNSIPVSAMSEWFAKGGVNSTALCHGRSNCPVMAERLRHLVEAEHHDENDEQEGNSEDAAPSVKSAKNETQQEPHRSHLPSSKPRPTPINNKTRPETMPTATHLRTADREYMRASWTTSSFACSLPASI